MSDENIVEMNKPSSNEIKRYVRIGLSLIVFVLLLIGLFNSIFIVKEGEYKVVRQFGEIVNTEETPGLKFKVPFIQTVTTLPQKKMVYDVAQKEINTLDKKRMIIDNYAVWHITDPDNMINTARNMLNAETRMGEFIFSVIRTELGRMNYEEIINDEKSSRGNLNERVTKQVNDLLARDKYGIRVEDVRIKRTDLPDENEQSVYRRMISERETKAQEYLSQGDAEKSRIIAQTDRDVKEMLAKADAQAAQIRGEGEQEAARIYNESFSKDESFYRLYRTLESYKKTIDGETTIILPQGSPYAQTLTGYFE
ncbi:protease modulator HflC [Pontibacillus marinus]|uniref:Protein HflC n=1 Tax=Pontibacillus marinus BH030004 = DSM 16465 TaxID=1385511 RepID=A0A0A5FXN5_9BACI|nr:protease modulator HflC [Pontibacillus marinus]KGX83575.1 tail fiber protein [Pontibacillus marinus BH030004 = DSM 16465]